MTNPSVAQRKWMQILHIAKKECALDDETYCSLLMGTAGVDSSSKITTWKQYNDCLSAFKRLGFRVQSNTSKKSGISIKETKGQEGRNPKWITAKQEYYIRGLWDLASRDKSLKSLDHFVKRITGAVSISWLPKKDASKVINAVRDMAVKAGFDPDKPPRKNKKGE